VTHPSGRSVPDPASYRDPGGFVFYLDGAVYRAVARDQHEFLATLAKTGLLDEWMKAGHWVRTRAVDPESDEHLRLARACPDWPRFLAHERIPIISYPYEWSFSMMADAALLTLRIQNGLLARGVSLKDASAFNVQFNGAAPVFIDVLSVERPRRLDVWTAYGQFCRMFLNPLLAAVHKGLGFRHAFLPDLEGLDNQQMAALFGKAGWLRPGLWFDVMLPAILERKASARAGTVRQSLAKEGGDAGIQQMNLARLERKINGLVRRRTASSAWSQYERTCTYTDAASAAKKDWVRAFLATHKPRTVLDLGCNQGAYSLLAAESGARVVAVDTDEVCVDRLYVKARDERLPILPLVVNVATPSPPAGFLSRERAGFLDRAPSDCVLALALVHHLLVAARLPPAAIGELFARLARTWLVVEFVEREDAMFRQLLALREDLYADLTLDRFVAALAPHFELVSREALPGTRRHLLALKRKS
jgi:SAM-dependent methyltransferase